MRTPFVLALVLAVSSVAHAVDWVQVSDLPGFQSPTCLATDPDHDRLFLGGQGGFRVYYPITDEWLIREDSGMWWVHSLLTHRLDPLFLLIGWYGGFFYGGIMDSYGLVIDGPIVWTGSFGAVTGLGRAPDDEDLLFACATYGDGPGGIYRSLDAGQTWGTVHHFASTSGTALAVAANGDVLVGHGSPGYPYTENGILRSEDGGESWVEISGDMSCAAFIGQIEVDPLDPQHIYVAQGGVWEPWDPALGVWETTDGGAHWEQIFDANVHDLCMDQADGDVLVALFDGGIVLTRDGGGTWVDIRGNLPDGPRVCAISPTDDRIYVATRDDELWATAASPTAAGDAPAAGLTLSAHPNPFNPNTTLAFSLREPGAVSLAVLDAQGRLVRSLLAEAQPAGLRSLTWDGRDDAGRALPSGLYFATLRASGERVSRKLLMLK